MMDLVLQGWVAAEIARARKIPIIGQGGITSAHDALEFMIAGASLTGVGTALFYDPLVCKKINAGLAAHLAQNKLQSTTALIGTLRTGKPSDLAVSCAAG